MSKPTIEEMLDWWDVNFMPKLNLILAMQNIEWCKIDLEFLQAIRGALIEYGKISDWLRELGVEVETEDAD